MSQRTTLIEAAQTLPTPFSVEQLVMSAWLLDKPAFGLKGHEEWHPDARKIQNIVYGRRGLITKGHLIVHEGGFRVPTRQEVQSELTPRLRLALQSRAYQLFDAGRKNDITFPMACVFWSIRPNVFDPRVGDAARAMTAELLNRESPERRGLGAAHDYFCSMFEERVRVTENMGAHRKGGRFRPLTG